MISIIIPTYNEEKAISKMLKHLTTTLTIPYEIIVTDDLSTDTTVEIAKTFPVKVVVNPHKKSIGANRNFGATHAHSEYIAFLDAGCMIHNPDLFFTKALEAIRNKKLAGLTCWIKVAPDVETLPDKIIITLLNYVYRISNNILHTGNATGKFQMVDKQSFDTIGGYNENLISCEDFDMFNRISKVGPTYFHTELTVYHENRRAHTLGWPRLLWIWTVDNIWFMLFKKSHSKEWKPVR
ncbi:MAG: glycosyltransferase [Patescibacteria group bacterium]